MKLIQTRQPREPIRVHFPTGPEETREAMRQALYSWMRNPRRSRKGQWVFAGEVLQHRFRVFTRWQDQQPAPELLRGSVVPAAGGGSDFVGEVYLPRSVWLARFLLPPIIALLYIGTVASIVALLLGHHGLAHRFTPFAPAPFVLTFSLGLAFWRRRRARKSGRGSSIEALKNWVSTLPGSSPS